RRAEPAFVAEGGDERSVLELGAYLRRNAAGDVDPADRERLEGEVAGFSPVDGHEDVERLHGARIAALEGRLAHDCTRIAALHPRAQPLGLGRAVAGHQEPVDVVEAGPGDDALVADAPELAPQELEEIDL